MEVIRESWPSRIKPETRVIIYDTYLWLTEDISKQLDTPYRCLHVFKKILAKQTTLDLLRYRIQEDCPWENTVLTSEELSVHHEPDYRLFDDRIRLLTDLSSFVEFGGFSDLNFKW